MDEYRWCATTTDGAVHDGSGSLAGSGVSIDRIKELVVWEAQHTGKYTLVCDPEKNEHVRYFVRMRAAIGSDKVLEMPVFEISGFYSRVRLYLHPTKGPILSSGEVYI